MVFQGTKVDHGHLLYHNFAAVLGLYNKKCKRFGFCAVGTDCAIHISIAASIVARNLKMKLIIAYIQPERLNAVKQALFAREIYKMSATNALGCGQQGGYVHMYRGATEEVTLHKKMRLSIAVNDDYVQKTIDAIIEGARTGDIGDGKIFVLPMEECIRIRTGERGPDAIG